MCARRGGGDFPLRRTRRDAWVPWNWERCYCRRVPAKIRILGRWTAQVRGGVWSIIDGPDDLLSALNATVPELSGADPNPDLTVARAARQLFPDSEIYDFSSPGDPRRVY